MAELAERVGGRSLGAGLLFLLLLLTAQPASAQREAALRALQPSVRAQASLADTTLALRTHAVPHGRVDAATGVLRAAYRVEAPAYAGPPEQAARAYLREAAPAFGLTRPADELRLAEVRRTPHSSHVTFRQTLRDVPVYGRQVRVNLNAQGRPTMVLNGTATHLASHAAAFDPEPTLSAEAARQRAGALFTTDVRPDAPELVVYPSTPPRLAWHLRAAPPGLPGDWDILLDAHTGDLLLLEDRMVYDRFAGDGEGGNGSTKGRTSRTVEERTGREDGRAPDYAPASLDAAPSHSSPRPQAPSQTDGAGLVFDPDPLTSAGAAYGDPGFIDGDDADTPQLDAQRVAVMLPGITLGDDGFYHLEGPYVRIIGDDTGLSGYKPGYDPPAEPQPDAFTYRRSHDGFEAVMAYYHIDRSQRYAQTLDVGRPLQEAPIRVNPQGSVKDESGYSPTRNAIGFGTGSIDDAEDADVLWHEYGHALLEASAAGLTVASEGAALHEGWSDYWAASYSRHQMEAGLVPVDGDWRRLFQWDGNTSWPGRVLDAAGRYPEDTRCDDPNDTSGDGCDIYADGVFWATAMMDVYTALGRALTDRLHLAAFGYLTAPATFRDAAEAVVQADIDLHGGANVPTLLDVLEPWGLVDRERYGPALAHETLPATEDVGGTVHVEASATAVAADVEQVLLIYRIDSAQPDTLQLEPQADNRYAATLDLPDAPSTIRYFLVASDVAGRQSFRPARAPSELFHFDVGPDYEPPSITHAPPPEAAMQSWPLVLDADVTDNLGVDSVWVSYIIEDAGGAPADSGRFGLAAAGARRYAAAFPTPIGKLQQDGRVRYRLHARDAAMAANEGVTRWYAVPITGQGMLRAYDFESTDDLAATGSWARGEPGYGLHTARSGRSVWATAPDDAYAAAPSQSSLTLPDLDLTGLGDVYLVFWHWYDTERRPLPDTLLFDGGNVKVSTDGETYRVAEPLDGYDGTLAQGRLNDMGGEPAFGGYSYGWRRVVVPLPDSAGVHIRFDFGTDGFGKGSDGCGQSDFQCGTSVYTRAGWHLDDVLVTTRLPSDLSPPQIVTPPPAVLLRSPKQGLAHLSIEVSDDQGVTDAFVEYEGFERGTARLAMHPADRTIYEGALEPSTVPSTQDSLTYRVRLRDAAGRETVYPSPGDAPLIVRFRHLDVRELLDAAQAVGLWTADTPGWRTRTGSDNALSVSSLVLAPLTLPANAETLELTLEHRLALRDSLGGNVKLSTDGGATWQVLAPTGGYDGALAAPAGHAMQDEPVFAGEDRTPRTSRFDLLPYAGQAVQLRVDLAAPRALAEDESWSIAHAGLVAATRAARFEAPLTFDLGTPYPNPARASATLHYTLPDEADGRDVRMEVYDVIGRRVAVPVDARQSAGTHTVTLDVAGWAAGTYFVRLTAGGHRATTRLVVVR